VKIAILGCRGVPGRYGGFETFSTELAPRLVERGHNVTVYCNPRYCPSERPADYRGVRLCYLPVPSWRTVETPLHELRSLIDALHRDYDVLYVLAFRASLLYVLPRIAGRRIVFNTDGLDWKRSKWNWMAQAYLKFSEAVGARIAADALIADSRGMQEYIREAHGRESVFIPYGAPVVNSSRPELLRPYGLAARSYFLVVARLEPENNVHVALESFAHVSSDKPLVVVGGANYRSEYHRRLERLAGPGVLFTGPIYDPDVLNELWCNCYAYIHGHQVGGTNPSLLQAMGAGCCVLAHDVNFNREVVGDSGFYWQPTVDSLTRCLRDVLRCPEERLDLLRERARETVRARYDWERVTADHETVFGHVCGACRAARRTPMIEEHPRPLHPPDHA